MIEKEKIEAIKRDVDLVSLIKSRGIKLRKNGKGYKGHCPFHEDKKTPSLSVTPSKNLFQCFGCGKAGDQIEFVKLFDHVDFKEAVQTLSGQGVKKIAVKKKKAKSSQCVRKAAKPPAKLLARVVDFYHTTFSEDARARSYLEGRGITDKGLFSDYKQKRGQVCC